MSEAEDRLVLLIKAEARRRIELSGLPWMVERQVSGGDAVPALVTDYCEAVRDASNALEADLPATEADIYTVENWPDPVVAGAAIETIPPRSDPVADMVAEVQRAVAARPGE